MESIRRARWTAPGLELSPRRLQNYVEIELCKLTSVQNSLSSPAGKEHAHAQRDSSRSPNYGTNTIVVPPYEVQICAPQVVAWDHDQSSDVTSISGLYNISYIDEAQYNGNVMSTNMLHVDHTLPSHIPPAPALSNPTDILEPLPSQLTPPGAKIANMLSSHEEDVAWASLFSFTSKLYATASTRF
jgi:hypothetical protein